MLRSFIACSSGTQQSDRLEYNGRLVGPGVGLEGVVSKTCGCNYVDDNWDGISV